MATNKITKKEPAFTILEKSQVLHKPIAYPTTRIMQSWAKSMGLTIGTKPNVLLFGFTLNANSPDSPGNGKLLVPLSKYVTVKDWGQPPYYYSFSQWFYDGAWSDNVPGKVTIKFDKALRIQNGIIFLRVGGHQSLFGGGCGYTVKRGNSIQFIKSTHDNSNGYDDRFVSQVIPIRIKIPVGVMPIALTDIEITSNMGSWKFFDAHYDPRIVI